MTAISFLVCTRNRANTVYQCVQELLSSPRQDFEVVVRDNCSDDNTIELLNNIKDRRLKINRAPENQGTITFNEVSKLASGNIVTWLSDEDSFQFSELDFIIGLFERNSQCNVILGGIIVGPAAREVLFPEEIILDEVQAHVIALSFSGCGGVFVRKSALHEANGLAIKSQEDAYALWNYYPVGFFASRCLDGSLITTSKIVVIQNRFARTTNNWSEVASIQNMPRLPHYYPDPIFDRLISNIVNILSKDLPVCMQAAIIIRLFSVFRMQTLCFTSPEFLDLLRENYSQETVCGYLNHLMTLGVHKSLGRNIWMLKIFLFSFVPRLRDFKSVWMKKQKIQE